MKRSLIIMTSLAALSGLTAAPLLASQSGERSGASGQTEAQMFLAAKVSLGEASDLALKEASGLLSAIEFSDEDGRGVYEAMIVDNNGVGTIVMIDADTGAVLARGLASLMDDDDDDGDDDDDDGDEDSDS